MPRGRRSSVEQRPTPQRSTTRTRHNRAQPSIEKELREWMVLNDYIIDLFGLKDFSDFQKLLSDAEEGYDENGQSYYFQRLKGQQGLKLPIEKLEIYETNIKKHLYHINERREDKKRLKYFQYLAALFTEIYLDKYFTDGEGKFSSDLESNTISFIDEKPGIDHVSEYGRFLHTLDDLRRITFWMATGSGKTLLFHLNYLQFLEYNHGPHRLNFDNVLLITPDDKLTIQHLRDMKLSSISGEEFNGMSVTGYFANGSSDSIKVIDIHKLTDDKTSQDGVTVDIEHFGSKNLVFVDEAHKGSGGRKWKYFKSELAKDGFTFEYSATIGQAVAGAQPREIDQEDPFARYAKSVLFDYSYPNFYKDGYGKEFRILNLKRECYDARDILICANLLTFYQQKLVLKKNPAIINEYQIKEPLWIFVGNKVLVNSEQSDVLVIVKFLHKFISDRQWALQTISDILKGSSGLHNEEGHDIFDPNFPDHRLNCILDSGYNVDNPETLYQDILKDVFRTIPGKPLVLVNLKNTKGEIGMRYGDDEFFGIIYIGEPKKFLDLATEVLPDVFVPPEIDHPSLFDTIESKESRINMLVGANKFRVGWDTFRVSCMGLMRMGEGVGTEIIQLFGRGVRLRGKNGSLKRSTIDEPKRPQYLQIVETLNIFALGADYLDTFKSYVDKEGMDIKEKRSFPLKIEVHKEFLQEKLIVPKISKDGFENSSRLIIGIQDIVPVTLNLIPRVGTVDSDAYEGMEADRRIEPVTISSQYLDLLDWDQIYYDLLKYIKLKGYHNIAFSKDLLPQIVMASNYTLFCQDKIVKPKRYADIDNLSDLVTTLLQKSLLTIISKKKSSWLMKNLNVETITEEHNNFAFKHYCIMINEDETEIIESIRKITENELERFYSAPTGRFITNIYFDHNLFQPLLALGDEKTSKIKIQPIGLVKSEKKFVTQLREYIEKHPEILKNQKIFLLRNQSRVGIGFFKNVWYYPDFIIWVKDAAAQKQRIIFADPKGIAHLHNGFNDEKVQLCSDIKHVQAKIAELRGKDDIELESFIVADNTRAEANPIFRPKNQSDYERNHIVFLNDENCIPTILGINV